MAVKGDVVRDEPERLTGLLGVDPRLSLYESEASTMELVARAGYKLDKDMDESLWENKYHMFERIPWMEW